jgi:lipoprotein NlpD
MLRGLVIAALLLATLAGCTRTLAPIEDRSSGRQAYTTAADGSYRVRPGDSLHAIAFNFGLDWRDIARWNGIDAPYVIHPDQVLRLGPGPESERTVTTTAARPAPRSSDRAATRDVATAPVEPPKSQVPDSQKPPASTAPPPASRPAARTAAAGPDPKTWQWPADGRILSRFKPGDPSRNGVEIGGEKGQPIRATAAGEVVYSGNGLIGYGELIIIKHSDRMLSAYGHNRTRLVSEGQSVTAGEKIAEMGTDERNRVLLHFEIRRDGTPQDPLKYLPGR